MKVEDWVGCEELSSSTEDLSVSGQIDAALNNEQDQTVHSVVLGRAAVREDKAHAFSQVGTDPTDWAAGAEAPGVPPSSEVDPGSVARRTTSGATAGTVDPPRSVVRFPMELYQRVKRAAEERRTYQTELLLDAFSHHQEALRDEHAGRHVRASLPPRPRPRRRHLDQGVSPCVLFLSAEEREIIDKAATELEMSRLAYVSLLFERELGDEPA